MTRVDGPRVRLVSVLIGLAVVLALFGVFWLPWLVSHVVRPVYSLSQAVGFDNRVAMLSLAFGCVALLILGIAAGGDEPTQAVVSLRPGQDRLPRWLVAGFAGAGVVQTWVLAFLWGNPPAPDATYFLDRAAYALRGFLVYRDFEFSYGPALLYPQVIIASALRALGMPVSVSYYVWMSAVQVVGLLALAYVVNRLGFRGRLRRWVFVAFGCLGLLWPTLGPNYSFARFLAPFVLMLWCLERVRHGRWWALTPAVAVASAFLVSPEMGAACGLGLLVALAAQAGRADTDARLPLGILAAALVSGGLVVVLSGGSAAATFAGGAFYFPVLPSLPVLIYLGSCLVLAFGVGYRRRGADEASFGPQLGWLAVSVVLIAPALGRADFGHVFWNGLGPLLGACAVLAAWRSRAGWIDLAGVAATFAVLFVVFAAVLMSGPALGQLTRAGVLGQGAYETIWRISGRPPGAGTKAWVDRSRPVPVPLFPEVPRGASVAAPFPLTGEALLQSDAWHLVPSYAVAALDADQANRIEAALTRAQFMILPASVWSAAASSTAEPQPSGHVLRPVMAPSDGTPLLLKILLVAPWQPRLRFPVLDWDAEFKRAIRTDWTPVRSTDTFVLLQRRSG